MSISAISSQSRSSYPVTNNNDPIKLLQKQKETLQELIQKTKEGKMDEKTKQERVKQLEEQIQEIDAEIRQRQAEKFNKSKDSIEEDSSKQPTTQEASGNSGTVPSMSGMTALIEAGSSYSNIKKINDIKKGFHNSGIILKREIKEDEARSLSGTPAAAKRKELHEMESKEKDLGKKASDALRMVKDHIESSSKQEEKKPETKDDENIDNNSNSESVSAAEVKKDDSNQVYKKIDVKI